MSEVLITYSETDGSIVQINQQGTTQNAVQLDSLATNVQNAVKAPSNYKVVNGAIVEKPTINGTLTSKQTGAWVEYTLALSTSDGNPQDVTMNIGPYQKSIPAMTSGTETFSVHQSILGQSIPVYVTGNGVISFSANAGSTSSMQPTTLQTYTDTSGVVYIAPTQKSYLQAFYALSPGSIESMISDLATNLYLVDDMVFRKTTAVLRIVNNIYTWATKLSSGAYVPTSQDLTDITNVQFTADEANAASDIETNFLPNAFSTLLNVYPRGGAMQLQYKDLIQDSAKTYQAFESYMTDLNTIPNLV